jgi:hypothetical protein
MATLEEFRQKLASKSDAEVASLSHSFWGAYGLQGDGSREWLAKKAVLPDYEKYFCLNLGLLTESEKVTKATIDTATATKTAADAAVDAARYAKHSAWAAWLATAISLTALLISLLK